MINIQEIKDLIQNKLSNKKILLLSVIGLVLLVIILRGLFNVPKYETEKIEKRTITQVVEASGTINPVNTYSVGATVSGLVTAVYADYNSPVKKGQLLALIDPRTAQESVNQNLANLGSAQANLRDMQSNANMNLKTLKRYRNLYNRNFIPKSELDQAESNYISSLAKVQSAKDEIARAKSQYKNSVINLSFTRIISPVDGVIISKKIEEGQPVAASFQAPEHFIIAEDLKKMQIEVNVSEADIGSVKEGQMAEFTLDGYPDTTFKGVVKQVRLSPTTVSNVVTYTVVVSVDNHDLKLKPGMTANVSIITSRHENVLCVPNMALKFSPKNNSKKYNKQGIWVKSGCRIERIAVKTGLSDDSYTEISSEKIKSGEKVVIGYKGDKKNRTKAMSGGGGRMMRPF